MSAAPADFWDTLPLGRGVEFIVRDANGLAAFAKPAGVLSHPNESADQPRSLLTSRYDREGECFEWNPPGGGTRRLWLLNRLDAATSGVIMTASSEALAQEIRALFQRKQVYKAYQALVFGQPSAAKQVWRDRLAVLKKGGVVRADTGGNIPAEAAMTVLRQQRAAVPPLALLLLEPKTGRSHQLRVQCAKRRLPIAGDGTYGDFPANRAFAKRTGFKRLFLHSHETSFDYDFGGRSHAFKAIAPLPPEFAAALKG